MNQAVLAKVFAKHLSHTRLRANQLSDTAFEFHMDAPRGGNARNRFGENRSAGGEPPAPETRELSRKIQDVKEVPDGADVVVNYKVLEFGYQKNGRILEPRPLGRIAIEQLRSEINAL
jgi:hypothetical protein